METCGLHRASHIDRPIRHQQRVRNIGRILLRLHTHRLLLRRCRARGRARRLRFLQPLHQRCARLVGGCQPRQQPPQCVVKRAEGRGEGLGQWGAAGGGEGQPELLLDVMQRLAWG